MWSSTSESYYIPGSDIQQSLPDSDTRPQTAEDIISTVTNPRSSRDVEREEISKRKNNIVIQSLYENGEKGDIEAIVEINRSIGNQSFSKYDILKIGRIGEKRNGYPRPLKVELKSQITKINIMRNANHLQSNEKYKALSIQHDLTRNQANKFRLLKEESKRVEEENKDGNWRYRVRGPPGRWQIVKIPKN